MYVPREAYSFRMSFCTVPASFVRLAPCFWRNRHIERQQDCRRGIDCHRSGNAFERYAFEQALHIGKRVDGDADVAYFAFRHRVVAVVADLRGKIECDGETGDSLFQQIAKAFVGFLDRARIRRIGASSTGANDTSRDKRRA